jgi:hypothetical protein
MKLSGALVGILVSVAILATHLSLQTGLPILAILQDMLQVVVKLLIS